MSTNPPMKTTRQSVALTQASNADKTKLNTPKAAGKTEAKTHGKGASGRFRACCDGEKCERKCLSAKDKIHLE